MGLRPRCLEHERQPTVDGQRLQAYVGRQPFGVHRRLPLHSGQRGALGLGLDHADRAPVDVQQVVGPAVPGGHDRLSDGYPVGGEQVQPLAVLHSPAGIAQLAVDEHPCALLGRQSLAVPFLTHGHRSC
ncbi:MAG: hypothetical protein ACR2KG_07590 [Nocardioidaceae bacterium]